MNNRKRCESVFENYRCSLEAGHKRKHLCTDDGVFVSWTDAGLRRIAEEKIGLKKPGGAR